MGRFVDCQMAVTPWGGRAKFRRARVGLIRKGTTVFLAVFSNLNSDSYKLPIITGNTEILPAAIRFKDLEKDLFIRNVIDEQKYNTMIREIKIILKRNSLRQGSKLDAFDRFISRIPTIDDVESHDLVPSRLSARVIQNPQIVNTNQQHQQHQQPDDGFFPATVLKERPNHQQLNNKLLKSITISGLVDLPEQLWLRTSIRELTLTECNLTSVPQQLMIFSSTLTSLNLSNNSISKLPRAFCCRMNRLISLDLSHNQIETLPIEIKFFRRLIDLDVSENRLRMLPSTFSDLKSLRNLNVANNNLSQLPAFRREEIRLTRLDVSFNPLDGALTEASTFEVFPSGNDGGYEENVFCPLTSTSISKKKHFPRLFEISMLKVVRCDRLLKLASEKSLPRTIVSTMQRDIFKCYRCGEMNILPAYNSTDILDYVDQVEVLKTTGNYSVGMTFMKLLCSSCFDNMSS